MTIFFIKYFDVSNWDDNTGNKVEFFETLQKCFTRMKEIQDENEACKGKDDDRYLFDNGKLEYHTIQFNKTDSKYLCDKLNEINNLHG